MKYRVVERISKSAIEDLKGKISGVLIDNNPSGQGFVITLSHTDGTNETVPGPMNLGEALGFALGLQKLIKLPDQKLLVSAASIEKNKSTDLDAFKLSKHMIKH